MSKPPQTPSVSVLMPVHNGEAYIESALRSIMKQSLRDIEIIVVDDASRDTTPQILARLASEDPRIRVETLVDNLRLPGALNRGLELVRAPYVARMDADDIAHPTRLDVQKRFMDAHPGVILSGGGVRYISAAGEVRGAALRPRDAICCRWLLRFMTPLTHPTFMFRAQTPEGFDRRYDPAFSVSEDHDFATRIARHGDIVSLSDVLLDYRQHEGSITAQNWALQGAQSAQITLRHCEAELDPEILAGLAAFRAVFYDFESQPAEEVFAGLRAMRAQDLRRYPTHRAWIRRQTAQVAFVAFQRAGMSKGEIIGAFARSGRDFLPAMAMRALEVKKWLPAALRSESDI